MAKKSGYPEREPGYILNCPNCGDKLVPGYTAKTLEEFLQRERPDFWFCDHCQLEYKETKTGKLKRSMRGKLCSFCGRSAEGFYDCDLCGKPVCENCSLFIHEWEIGGNGAAEFVICKDHWDTPIVRKLVVAVKEVASKQRSEAERRKL